MALGVSRMRKAQGQKNADRGYELNCEGDITDEKSRGQKGADSGYPL